MPDTSEQSNRSLLILATAHGDITEPDDRSVPGAYRISDIPRALPDEDAYLWALEAFHRTVAVERLEDFDLSVVDTGTGRILPAGVGAAPGGDATCRKVAQQPVTRM
ncbi:hypothetical protein TK90_2629 (plasmid) [Thioalkalivibrio sp. K90mix]|uniref:hypothetical protein n=1 Tax=Thioalkalivibrio sp. (strain K90mix) TaxID=396595 RepID=UPI000195AB91|nr:hypothetical protein [Thioalkalivibrio sp. K90mix]ADC73116.1 hypothetical protein TK90_2629 [Thioalkalivibrio sp. K90mix]